MHNAFFTYILISIIFIASNAYSEEETQYKTHAAPEVLNQFIHLEGEWVGRHVNHQGEEEQLSLIYRTVSGDTAVEERIFANTPKEMITVYHGSGDDSLLMTHYCMLGNQPRLKLIKTNDEILEFEYFDGTGIDRKTTGHMGGMKMKFIDNNTLEQEWAYYEEGEIKNISKFTFTRKEKI